jgi:hypothetical protein
MHVDIDVLIWNSEVLRKKSNGKQKTEAQAIFHNPFTFSSS